MPTVAERVVRFIQDKTPSALCDACIAREMGLARTLQAYHVTNVLGLTSDYVREKARCTHCKEIKTVTRLS